MSEHICGPNGCIIKREKEVAIEAGDTVLHKPTGEKWFLLGVNKAKNRVCVAGWPPKMAELSDCELRRKGKGVTEEEREYRDGKFGTDWD